MKTIIISALLLAAPFLATAAGEGELELAGLVSAWTQDCSGPCALPVPGERNRPLALRLALPAAPGEAAAAHALVKLALPGGGELPADLDFYAVCPYGGRSGCPGRYFQVQLRLGGTAPAFCSAALNAQDFSPFPVLTCAGVTPAGLRYGLTLHRLRL